jgi:hypothetical protein
MSFFNKIYFLDSSNNLHLRFMELLNEFKNQLSLIKMTEESNGVKSFIIPISIVQWIGILHFIY